MSAFTKAFFIALFLFPISIYSFDQDGGWSPWSKLETPCQKSSEDNTLVVCNGGVRIRYRSCTMPVPQVKNTLTYFTLKISFQNVVCIFIKCLYREMVYHALEMISNTNLAIPILVNYLKNTFGPLGANVPKSAAEG